jgi:Protein of unknown function (DUF2505)
MKRLTESWTLPCSAERYWDVFVDPDYSRALYLDGLRFKDYQVISNDPSARKLRLVPRLNLPAPLAKVIGEAFAYEQHGSLDRKTGLWTWRMAPPGDPKGKEGVVSSRGSIRVVDAGPGQCTRTDEVTLSGNVFGLGGLMESAAEKELRSSWQNEIAFLRRWLAERA